MTAALTLLARIGTLGMFLKPTLFSPGAAAVRPASLGHGTASRLSPSRRGR